MFWKWRGIDGVLGGFYGAGTISLQSEMSPLSPERRSRYTKLFNRADFGIRLTEFVTISCHAGTGKTGGIGNSIDRTIFAVHFKLMFLLT
jgi:hypothetical protein